MTTAYPHCQRYPSPQQDCHTCGSTCFDPQVLPGTCPNWQPDRAGHPSTANPCEGRGFDLCLNECAGCPHIPAEEGGCHA